MTLEPDYVLSRELFQSIPGVYDEPGAFHKQLVIGSLMIGHNHDAICPLHAACEVFGRTLMSIELTEGTCESE